MHACYHTLVVVDLLSITGLQLVNCDVRLLNIVIGEPQPRSGYVYRADL